MIFYVIYAELFLYAESALVSSTSLDAFQFNPYNCVLVRMMMYHMPHTGYLPVAFNFQFLDPKTSLRMMQMTVL